MLLRFPIKNNSSFNQNKDYSKERKELKMIDAPMKKNNVPYKGFDCSIFNEDNVVLLVDGDWLAFSATSKEMERYLEYKNNGEIIEFSGYKQFKQYCIENDIDYSPSNAERKQRNHNLAVAFAKSSIKKKIAKGIEETGATSVVIFCGSDGNDRALLPLPKLNNIDSFVYKGSREVGWIPDTLPEVKTWLMDNWMSWWSVNVEADDSITMAKASLDDRGIKNYIYAIDKDFNGELYGGMYIVSHQEHAEWFENTPENNLGYIKAIKTEGGSDKMTGRGDMFLSQQIILSDPADNYSAKAVLKKYGTLKSFGYKACEKYLMQAKNRRHLWELVLDHFVKHLPPEFEYEDCFGVMHTSSPLKMLDLFFKAATMRRHENHIPDVIEDRLKPLGVKYE